MWPRDKGGWKDEERRMACAATVKCTKAVEATNKAIAFYKCCVVASSVKPYSNVMPIDSLSP